MVQERNEVRPTSEKRAQLRKVIRSGRSSAQVNTLAPVLLKIDEGWTAPQVAAATEVTERTVFRIKRRFAGEGLEETLHRRNQVNRRRKVDGRVDSRLIALACSAAPEGHGHWTLRALAGRTVELGLVESLSHETVRLHLKKTRSSPRIKYGAGCGESSSGASPR